MSVTMKPTAADGLLKDPSINPLRQDVGIKGDLKTIAPVFYYLQGGVACLISEVLNNKVASTGYEMPYSAVAIIAVSILHYKGCVSKYPWIGSFYLQAAVPLALKAVNIVTPKGDCKWKDNEKRWQVTINENLSGQETPITYYKNEQKQQWETIKAIPLKDYTVDPLLQLRVRQVCKVLFSGAALSLPLLAYKGSV